MDSKSIAALEAVGEGPFVVRHRGETITLPDPRRLTVDEILVALYSEVVPGFTHAAPLWKINATARRWAAHFDLPDLRSVQRLIYLLDRYRDEIEFDLQQHLDTDLVTLWRDRRWRKLLNLIDHLPRESWFSEAVSNDEEHAQMVADARAKAEIEEEVGTNHPPMRTWTPEVAVLTDILDAIRSNTHTLAAVNAVGKNVPSPSPAPRPTSALERAMKVAKFDRRKAAHEKLVARMLPHKAAKSG